MLASTTTVPIYGKLSDIYGRRKLFVLADVAKAPLALAGWSAGVAMIWSALFMVGNYLYGRMGYAAALAAVFAVSAAVVMRVVNRLWR